ncbi:MAG: chain-length determining protein [Gammaproteobacteria bacterium]|nr:chain-length determining protein [Gammaproteobacteria bacterium]
MVLTKPKDTAHLRLMIIEHALGMWRFRWVALTVAWMLAVAGWLFILSMPNRYDAAARVYVNTDSILKPLLAGLAVPTDTLSQVGMMTQAMLSRPQLETVAAETGLMAKARTPEEIESLLTQIRTRISITKAQGEDIYVIAFQDPSPTMARDVVQALLTSFMQNSLTADRSDSVQAQKFIESQIAVYEKRLVEAEERLAAFKKNNVGLMPGEGGDYFARMQTAQAALQTLQGEISAVTQRKSELERQLEGEEPTFGLADPSKGMAGGGATSVDATIGSFESQLEQLRLKFTDKHPDIVNVQKTLEDLYRLRDEERARNRTISGGTSASAALNMNPVYQDMRMALSRAEVELAGLRSQLAAKQGSVSYLRRMIDTIPEVEAQLNRLNRDYEVVKRQHDALLGRLESARLADQVQQDSEAVSFDILEPPREPLLPAAPNRLILNLFVLVAGLGAGSFLAFALNKLDPVFYSSSHLKEALQVPVFGTLPRRSAAVVPDQFRPFALGTGALVFLCIIVNLVGQNGLAPLKQLLAG